MRSNPPNKAMPTLAIFDLDYTLTEKGTWGRFMAMATRGRPLRFMSLWIDAGVSQLAYKLGLIPRIRVKQRMMAHAIVGWDRRRLEKLADSFASAEVPDKLNPRVLAALQAHQDAGDVVLIASAAVDLLAEPIAKRLSVAHYVATDMAWTEAGALAGHFGSDNCYGSEKLRRIQQWLKESHLEGSFDHIIAYSDSRSDAPMLEYADHAIIVRPNAATRRYAQEQDFEIWA